MYVSLINVSLQQIINNISVQHIYLCVYSLLQYSYIVCVSVCYRGRYTYSTGMVYFNPKTARNSVDCGRCLGAQFDECQWARFAL